MNSAQQIVREFHTLIGAYTVDRPMIPTIGIRELRKRLIEEEWEEFCRASDSGSLVDVADALGDLLVVVYGAGLAFGLDLEPIFKEIHRTNMLKIGGPTRADGKQLKPEGWQPPDLETIVYDQFGATD